MGIDKHELDEMTAQMNELAEFNKSLDEIIEKERKRMKLVEILDRVIEQAEAEMRNIEGSEKKDTPDDSVRMILGYSHEGAEYENDAPVYADGVLAFAFDKDGVGVKRHSAGRIHEGALAQIISIVCMCDYEMDEDEFEAFLDRIRKHYHAGKAVFSLLDDLFGYNECGCSLDNQNG